MVAELITVMTPSAESKLLELRGDDPSRAYLRLFVQGRGCCGVQYGMTFESEIANDDVVIDRHGVPLTIDPESCSLCDGITIDYVHTEQGEGFTVRGPASGSGCGCRA
jgi:iron-sulfur cluster assembly protein